MFKSHYTETLVVTLALVMGLIMALAVIVVDGLPLNYSTVFSNWAMITFVILLVSIFVPYKEWSGKLTRLVCKDEKSLAYKLVGNILPSLVLNTCNTVLVSAANILYNEAIPAELQVTEWTQGILRDWPIMFVVSYLAAFGAEALGSRVANKYARA